MRHRLTGLLKFPSTSLKRYKVASTKPVDILKEIVQVINKIVNNLCVRLTPFARENAVS